MVNYFKKISIRNELEVSFDADLAPLAPFRGARLLHHNLGSPASTGELKFIRKIMRAIREALLGRKRKKNELAQIIGLSFGFDNTRIYVKGEKNHSHLLGEFSRGEFRKSSSY